MMPFPLPVMWSSKWSWCFTWEVAKARISSFCAAGRTRELKAEVLKVTGVMEGTRKESQRLSLRA